MPAPSAPNPSTIQVDPNRGFKIWGLGQIYGPNSSGTIVPNVGDLSYDPVAGWQYAQAINPSTYYTTWTPLPNPGVGNILTPADILLGQGPGTQSESFRMFYNNTLMPYSLAPDGRLHMYSNTIVGYKVFLGTDDSAATGQVISQYYDQAGNLIGETIPMVPTTDSNGAACLAPAPGSTMQALTDGQVVTLVFYDADAGPVSVDQLIVKNGSYIRQLNAAMKYITSIELVSDFLSQTDQSLIEIPVNMPVDSLPMMGQVNYSDGTSMQHAVDGTIFQLAGLHSFVATTIGQQADLVLFYQPASNEAVYGTSQAPNQKVPQAYKIQTTNVNGAYSPKLYAFPRWVNATYGYTMEYYLSDLDRQQYYYVTPFVNPNPGSAVFNGLLYGQTQQLVLKVNLSQVDPVRYNNFTFVTTIWVSLLQPGTSAMLPLWTTQYAVNQNPQYGSGTAQAAVFTYQSVNNWKLDISCGCTNEQQWLDLLYNNLLPLYNQQAETTPPVPNMVNLIFPGAAPVTIPVSQWNTTIGPIGNYIPQGGLLYLEFFYRSSTGDQVLGVAALPAEVVQPA
ncbi:MAG TPA: hypothetical protein VN081_06510 [Dongiaceae bacterium]|nr:hypothetical protein [Dongiaceae bacterium]